jgi:hypothetical protein
VKNQAPFYGYQKKKKKKKGGFFGVGGSDHKNGFL